MENMRKEKGRELHPIIIGVILFFAIVLLISGWRIIRDRNKEGESKRDSNVDGVASGTDIWEQSKELAGVCVAVDPGHGGNDPGKVSQDGILEKDINLQISTLLMEELRSRGANVTMTRDTDCNLATEGATNKKVSDMKNRVALINEVSPKVLVSIHQNSFSDSSVRGPQVFYNGQSKDSEEFALILQERLSAINPEYGREAKTGNDYYILNKSTCAGVIVECGFLSCPEETALLNNKEYQQKIASAIADAIEEAY